MEAFEKIVMDRIAPQAFTSYNKMLSYLMQGRSPRNNGRAYTTALRLYLQVDNSILVKCHDTKVAVVYPTDEVLFIATQSDVYNEGMSLAYNFSKVLPLWFYNVGKGRYKVLTILDMASHFTTHRYVYAGSPHMRAAATEAQEYFHHLRIDLKTGKVLNPKDMTPTVDEKKRKVWLANQRKVRLQLRTMARLGVFEGKHNGHDYFRHDDIERLAHDIMAGKLSDQTIRKLIGQTSPWRAQRDKRSYSECVYDTFESVVKSNYRDMRVHVGVLDISD